MKKKQYEFHEHFSRMHVPVMQEISVREEHGGMLNLACNEDVLKCDKVVEESQFFTD